ncbi:MAG: hypothetical protein KKG33_11655 [candidate division Zixibacteria bacterium]|nr:hypothetical protein [candidate division Zixibacteria bacterium]MBU1472103.1 hypothetical protein [candidate division Zixibacteria bacterium]MBU2626203.1 hypothetical protein [candidate division Zixibacteria bacterium]
MKKWTMNDFNTIEKSPTSPAWLQSRFTDILYNSTNCRCKVESVNPTTGEYRVVLQGTFDKDEWNQNG